MAVLGRCSRLLIHKHAGVLLFAGIMISIALLLVSFVLLRAHGSAAGQKAVVWAPCGDAKSLASTSSWLLGTGQLQLAASSSGEEEGLCLTQPGKENTKGWGQLLEVAACNPADAGQLWALNRSMLQFTGGPAAASASAVCVAPHNYPGPPMPAAAAYPCQNNWDFILTKLAGSGPPGAIKLQMSAPKGKICLSYTDPAGGPAPPPAPVAPIPLPTAAQLAYQRQELVGLTHFNMATFFQDGDPACNAQNWARSQKPASFAPTSLNISNWIDSYRAVGVKSVILTAKHGCGFLLWPTNVTLPDGSNYGYHVGGKGGLGIDIVKMFAEAMQAEGLPHSFYYSLKDSFYLNAIGDRVKGGRLLPGQVNVTQEQFEDISVAAVTELWSHFGRLSEIWFDGGISAQVHDRIVHLLTTLQPDAVTYGSGISADKNAVDWVGTESGMPAYPVWSSGCAAAGGAGFRGTTPTQYPTTFCPKGSDCTLQAPDHWFWMPNTPIKSLATLIDMYHKSVGSNSVMELDFAIDRTGNIDPTHAERYAEFGAWIRSCYGTAVARTPWSLTDTLELAVASTDGAGIGIDRIVIQEDISRGQRITSYSVDAMVPTLYNIMYIICNVYIEMLYLLLKGTYKFDKNEYITHLLIGAGRRQVDDELGHRLGCRPEAD